MTLAIVTNGHLPYRFGRDAMGYGGPRPEQHPSQSEGSGRPSAVGSVHGVRLEERHRRIPGGYTCELRQGTPPGRGAPAPAPAGCAGRGRVAERTSALGN